MATKAKTVRTVDDVAGAAQPLREGEGTLVELAHLTALNAEEEFRRQAWAMRPTEQLAVVAVLKLLWLIALEIRALRKGEA